MFYWWCEGRGKTGKKPTSLSGIRNVSGEVLERQIKQGKRVQKVRGLIL